MRTSAPFDMILTMENKKKCKHYPDWLTLTLHIPFCPQRIDFKCKKCGMPGYFYLESEEALYDDDEYGED